MIGMGSVGVPLALLVVMIMMVVESLVSRRHERRLRGLPGTTGW